MRGHELRAPKHKVAMHWQEWVPLYSRIHSDLQELQNSYEKGYPKCSIQAGLSYHNL